MDKFNNITQQRKLQLQVYIIRDEIKNDRCSGFGVYHLVAFCNCTPGECNYI